MENQNQASLKPTERVIDLIGLYKNGSLFRSSNLRLKCQVESVRSEYVESALRWRAEHRRRAAAQEGGGEQEARGVDHPEQVGHVARTKGGLKVTVHVQQTCCCFL